MAKQGTCPGIQAAGAGGEEARDPYLKKDEKIEVSLTSQPLGVDGDIYIYKGQAACVNDEPDAWNPVVGSGDEELMWEETDETDDDLFIIRIENWGEPSCYGDYELRINGLK